MKTGVVLSGCGVMDGSEIHEAVLTMVHLCGQGSDIVCMAPDGAQASVVNHVTNQALPGEQRNMLVESARIARGDIQNLKNVHAGDVDALVFPGGFGAAKNLCSFAVDGPSCSVHPEAERLILEMHGAKKPLGALCIAPVLIARVLGKAGIPVQVTIGSDPGVAGSIQTMGAVHKDCPVHEAVVDETARVVTSPAYMLAQNISQVSESAASVVNALMGLANK